MYTSIDNFLPDFDEFRQYCDELDYSGMTNDADGVFYPGVTDDIPMHISQHVINCVSMHLGRPIVPSAMFLRITTEGTHAPHQAHTDLAMGKYGLMLYLNRVEDCVGGTSFVMHKETGMKSNPINDKLVEVWRRDTNNPEAWQVLDICEMRPNRAMIFDASMMHRAEPIGGFGTTNQDGRLVLVMFFND